MKRLKVDNNNPFYQSYLPDGVSLLVIISILAGLILILILIWYFRRKTSPCKWVKSRGTPLEGRLPWKCQTCGIKAYSSNRKPPKECKRKLKPKSL